MKRIIKAVDSFFLGLGIRLNILIRSTIKAVGRRKMAVFLLTFITTTVLFSLGYKVKDYGDFVLGLVGLLVAGNVGEHFAVNKKHKKGRGEFEE